MIVRAAQSSHACVPSFFVLVLLLAAGPVFAADAVFKGRLLHSLTGEPVADAKVVLVEVKRTTVSAADGTFAFDAVKPGTYHLVVEAQGFSGKHREYQIVAPETTIEVLVDPELHYTEVVSVSAEPRDQFSAYQPTSVLAGQDLTRELETSLAATVQTQPGMAVRSFGNAPARPVIRGLDGDRVLILEDGQRTGDLSSQSGDHGVTINPAAASKIEVVRGPAMLLYGSNAIGGLVNVIADTVPTERVTGASGALTGDLGSNGGLATGAGDMWWGNSSWAIHAGGGGSRSGDYRTPDGLVDNTQSRNGFMSVGVAWIGAKGYAGGSYGYEDTRYGLPFVEEGLVELTPRRHMMSLRAEARALTGFLSSVRASFAGRRYRHEEIVGGAIGTSFRNDTNEFEFRANHRPVGRFSGSMGALVLDRSFSAEGDEALSPPVDQRGFAAFLYEEVAWHHVTLQLGGRVDHAAYSPAGGTLPPRDFTNVSWSTGLLVNPPMLDHRTSYAISVARAARHPALEELYFNGPHPGNFAFEIGNANLESEHALGFDASFRWRSPKFSAEATYFRNSIADYIFRNPVEGLPEEDEHAHEGHHHGDLAVIEYLARDSLLQGVEIHADLQLTTHWFADLGIDYVRGRLKDTGEPLPRIPPIRARGSLRYQYNAFNAGAEVTDVAAQKRVFGIETPTGGYTLVKLFASYSFMTGKAVSTVTARIDNLTNELYRNHLSYVKDYIAEMGRTFKVVYNIKF
ncbi:MAG: TonB-dependent receptor [Acidobacteriota bacterium]